MNIKDLQDQIEREAEAYMHSSVRLIDDDISPSHLKYAHEAGATLYVERWQDSERRIKEAMELLAPLLDYGQSKEANMPLGASITTVILQRAKQFERAKKALEDIASGKELPQLIAQQALANWKEVGNDT